MKRSEMSTFDRLSRTAEFASEHVGLFPEYTAAPAIVETLGSAVTQASKQAVDVMLRDEAVQVSRKARAAARERLTAQLDLADRTARVLDLDAFKAPRKRNDRALIEAGRVFILSAGPYHDALVQCGLRIEALDSAVQEMEKAVVDHAQTRARRADATAAFQATLAEAGRHAEKLEALVANTLADRPTVLATWNEARGSSRRRRRKQSPPVSVPSESAPTDELK